MPTVVLANLAIGANTAISLDPWTGADPIFTVDSVRRFNGSAHTHTLSQIGLAHTHTLSEIALAHSHALSEIAMPVHRHGLSVTRYVPANTAPNASAVLWMTVAGEIIVNSIVSGPIASTATTGNAALNMSGIAETTMGDISGVAVTSMADMSGVATASGAVSQTLLTLVRSGMMLAAGSTPTAGSVALIDRSNIELGDAITAAYQLIISYTPLRITGGVF